MWAVAALFEHAGLLCQLTRLDATIPAIRLIDDLQRASAGEERPASAPAANPAAQRQAFTIRVHQTGMQRISGTELAHLGASRMPFDPVQFQLHHAGQEVALQLLDAEDGRIDAGDELRFYAPDPGDRWNQAATYWLTHEDQPGRRIARRASGPGTVPQRTTGQEAGSWQPRTISDSTRPGPDGDHWFADVLRSGPDQEAERITVPLTTTLPIAAGSVTLTITGSASTAGPHQLAVTVGTATDSVRWARTGDWEQTITLDTTATTATIALLPAAPADQVLLDRVQWPRLVVLDVDAQGATFQGEAGIWRYQLSGIVDGQALYDVSDPAQPVEIAVQGGFAAGPEAHRSTRPAPVTWSPRFCATSASGSAGSMGTAPSRAEAHRHLGAPAERLPRLGAHNPIDLQPAFPLKLLHDGLRSGPKPTIDLPPVHVPEVVERQL